MTLPLVLPPTAVGYLLLRVLDPRRTLGLWILEHFDIKLTMNWWSAIFSTVVVIFPLMYRTARSAFEAFDETLAYSGQTLGLSNTYIFWHIRMPACKQGILAGTVLAFQWVLVNIAISVVVLQYAGKEKNCKRKDYTIYTEYNMYHNSIDIYTISILISSIILLSLNL